MADTNETSVPEAPRDPLEMAIELLMDTLGQMPKSALDPQKSEAARNMILISGAMAQIEAARALRKIAELLTRADRDRKVR